MKKNLGTIDRGIRAVLGPGIIAYGIVNHTWLGAIHDLHRGFHSWRLAGFPVEKICQDNPGPNPSAGKPEEGQPK